jgi:hypothetical protein
MGDALDTSALGQLAAELMESIEGDYPEARLGVVAVVVELDEGGATSIVYRCSDARRWVQAGLFAAAGRAVIDSSETEYDD